MPLRISAKEARERFGIGPDRNERDQPPLDPPTNPPPLQQAASLGILALIIVPILLWLAKRMATLVSWSGAVLAVMIMYGSNGGMAAAGAALLALGLAGMVAKADSAVGRVFAAISQAFWMIFAVFTAGAALHRLGRRHLGGQGIFAHTARALLAAFVLTMLAAYGASIRAHGEPRHVSCGEVTDYPERHPHSHCFDDYKRPGESLLHAVKRFKRETKYDELIPCVTVRADPKRYPGSRCALSRGK
jgi:hypothetical protein